jgi:hypothetical protein
MERKEFRQPFTGDCPYFRGATVAPGWQNALPPRKMDCPLAPREGDRSMFSAKAFFRIMRFPAEKMDQPPITRERL